MKTISLHFTWSVLCFLMLILLTPSLSTAEENDSNSPIQIKVDVLNDASEKATILDVEVNDLLGIDNIDVEIPNANGRQNSSNEGNEEEKLVDISVADEEIGNMEVDVISDTESNTSSKKAVVDIKTEDLVVADDLDIEVLGQEETLTNTANSNERSLAAITGEDLVVADDVDIEVLGQEETLTNTANSNESSLAAIMTEDLVVADDVDIEVLGEEETLTNAVYSNESSLADIMAEDLVVADDLDIKVLGEEETLTNTANSNESSLAAIMIEDLVVADDVDIEVLGEEESLTNAVYSNENSLADIMAEDLVVGNGVEIEVLREEETLTNTAYSNESALADITAVELVVADDVEIEVLEQEESWTNAVYSNKSVLADITAEDLIVADDVEIEIIGQTKYITDSTYSSEAAVVDTELGSSIIADQIELDVLADKTQMINEGTPEDTTRMEKGAHLKLTNVPILEDVHVGILENQTSNSNDGYTDGSSLLNVEIEDESSNSLLNDLELNVLPISDSMEAELEQSSSSAISLETTDGLLGDLSADVLLSRTFSADDREMLDNGVVEIVSDQFPVTDQLHVGILDRHEMNGINKRYSNRGVLQLDALSDPLDQLTVDVLTDDQYTNSDGSSQINLGLSLGIDNDLLGDTTVQILGMEEFVAAEPTIIPNDPDESVENSLEEVGGHTGETHMENETPAIVDEGTEEVYADASESESMNENTNANAETETDSETVAITDPNADMNTNSEETEGDSIGENAINNEEDQDDASMFGNLSDISFNGKGMQAGSMLPKTGGFFDGMLLMLLALSLLIGGLTIHKFA